MFGRMYQFFNHICEVSVYASVLFFPFHLHALSLHSNKILGCCISTFCWLQDFFVQLNFTHVCFKFVINYGYTIEGCTYYPSSGCLSVIWIFHKFDLQVSLEGQISRKSAIQSLSDGHQPFGDQIPWKFCEQFRDTVFPSLSGARIVRIATHPSAMRVSFILCSGICLIQIPPKL